MKIQFLMGKKKVECIQLKINYIRYTLFLFLVVVLFSNCKKSKPDEFADYILTRGIKVYIIDSINGKNLIGKNGQPYHPDSIKIFTPNNANTNIPGRVVMDSLNNYYGSILYFYQLVSKAEDINIFSIDMPIYMYLNYLHTDTLKVKKLPFQDFVFYFKNNSIFTTPALLNTMPSIRIKK